MLVLFFLIMHYLLKSNNNAMQKKKKQQKKDIQYFIQLQNYSTSYSLKSKTVLHAQRWLKISNKTVFGRANPCKLFANLSKQTAETDWFCRKPVSLLFAGQWYLTVIWEKRTAFGSVMFIYTFCVTQKVCAHFENQLMTILGVVLC